MNRPRNAAAVAAPGGKYSHAVELDAGSRMLLISGQVGILPDGSIATGFEAQCRAAFANLQAILADAGMGFADVAKLGVFLTDIANLAAYRKVRDEFMGELRPASTLLEISGLVLPELQVEIEAIAARAPEPVPNAA
ncbi:MAG TPA: RidA family protein [Alphaproteobacteria bacterium]|nr:RidA family protein [Alphaproteobacteria bacterium]